jgi:hypothetical protein
MVPGNALLQFASRWFDAATVHRTFEPLVADWQHEWTDATGIARLRANIRGRLAFVTACVAAYPRTLRLPNPPVVTRRMVVRISAFCAVLAVLGLIPLYEQVIRPLLAANAAPGLLAAIILLPLAALVTAALPFAMAIGIDAIRCHEAWPDDVERRVTSRLILAVTLWMFVGGGWIIPALNHSWRTAVVTAAGADGAALARDAQDLSSSELLLASVEPSGNHAALTELALRLSLMMLPGLIAWVRWQMLEIQSNRIPFKVAVVMSLAGAIVSLQMHWQPGLPYFVPIRHLQPFAIFLIFVSGLALRGTPKRQSSFERGRP